MLRTAVFVSGGGTNLQAIINEKKSGRLEGVELSLVLSSKKQVYALKRAEKENIPTAVVERKACAGSEEFDEKILTLLEKYSIDVIVLAGFLSILGQAVIAKYPNKIINVHPSLIPSFCGRGYYGLKVHEEALKRGVKVTGATVHFVNEIPDGGEIILQKAVAVQAGDTPETLQKRVMEEAEWKLLPKALEMMAANSRKTEEGNRS